MVAIKTTAISAAALLALIQYSPAPFALIPVVVSIDLGTAAAWVGAAGGIISGAAAAANAANSAKHNKRDLDAIESVDTLVEDAVISRIKRMGAPFDPALGSEIEWRNCHSELQKTSIGVEKADIGSLRITNVPAACHAVGNKVHGRVGEGNPTSEGAHIRFDNLSDGKIQEVVDALHRRG